VGAEPGLLRLLALLPAAGQPVAPAVAGDRLIRLAELEIGGGGVSLYRLILCAGGSSTRRQNAGSCLHTVATEIHVS
jgi:hypothetical protein